MYRLFLSTTLVAGSLAPFCVQAAAISGSHDISQQGKPSTINVLVANHRENVLLESTGRFIVYNPENDDLLANRASGKFDIITATEQGLQWGDDLFSGAFQIRLVPGDSQSTLLVNGTEYRGCVEVYDIDGKLSVVNEVDIERYIKSTMSAQFSEKLHDEVLEAIAIAARTNIYYQVANADKHNQAWHVDAKEVGYLGHAFTQQNPALERAINRTRHMVLTHDNQFFPATWTKDSAGKTATFASIFRQDVPSTRGINTPFAAKEREAHSWSFALSKQELARSLGLSKITAFDLYEDKESDRIYAARATEGQNVHQIDFSKLQKALGAVRLKSNDFAIKVSGDQVIFTGHGEGHGVGICLFSAAQMAKHGEKAPKILSTFFPETKLQNIRTLPANSL